MSTHNPLTEVTIPWLLQTERLRLVLVHNDDRHILTDMYNAIKASQTDLEKRFSWMHPMPTKVSMLNFWANISRQVQKREGFYFAVYRKEPEDFVGFVSLTGQELCLPAFSLGYWGDSRYTGHGYMSEAVTAVCDFAINTLKVKRLDATPAVDNHASIAIVEKLAKRFAFEDHGIRKNAWRHVQTGELCHCKVYSFNQPDYRYL